MHDAALFEDLCERVGAEVRSVVGEDLVDGDVVGPEPPLGSPPEPDEGGGGLVVVGLDLGDTRVVVDCGRARRCSPPAGAWSGGPVRSGGHALSSRRLGGSGPPS